MDRRNNKEPNLSVVKYFHNSLNLWIQYQSEKYPHNVEDKENEEEMVMKIPKLLNMSY